MPSKYGCKNERKQSNSEMDKDNYVKDETNSKMKKTALENEKKKTADKIKEHYD